VSAAGLLLRAATPADAQAVSDVLAASYSTLYRWWYRDEALATALPAMTRARPELLASGRYFVVVTQGRVAACGGWSLSAPTGGVQAERGHIRHFATHPDHLSKGCAGAIMGRCLNEARAAGLAGMECLSSLTAEAFYARQGFDPVTPTTVNVGGTSFACILMRRAL
jgi:N-acetylglutamate synthase-like GNAT family acetyltransferase